MYENQHPKRKGQNWLQIHFLQGDTCKTHSHKAMQMPTLEWPLRLCGDVLDKCGIATITEY